MSYLLMRYQLPTGTSQRLASRKLYRGKLRRLAPAVVVAVTFTLIYHSNLITWTGISIEPKPPMQESSCEPEQWPDLELFLPLAPKKRSIDEYSQLFLPSFTLFWPESSKTKLLLLTDAEKASDKITAGIRNNTSKYLQNNFSTRLVLSSQPDGMVFVRGGWDRQQWLMFWAENFTNSEYVGFVDTDSLFVTRITLKDLFHYSKTSRKLLPIVRGLYENSLDPDWNNLTAHVYEHTGLKEPFNCMTYFPVILRTSHLKEIREHIRSYMKMATFDEAFIAFTKKVEWWSQFDFFCTILWYQHHEDYYWATRLRNIHLDIVPNGLEKDQEEAGTAFVKQLPSVALHWTYEKSIRGEENGLQKVIRTGVCFSMTDNERWPIFCGNDTLLRRYKINPYEWQFEGYHLEGRDEAALQAHRDRLSINAACPHEWPRDFSYPQASIKTAGRLFVA